MGAGAPAEADADRRGVGNLLTRNSGRGPETPPATSGWPAVTPDRAPMSPGRARSLCPPRPALPAPRSALPAGLQRLRRAAPRPGRTLRSTFPSRPSGLIPFRFGVRTVAERNPGAIDVDPSETAVPDDLAATANVGSIRIKPRQRYRPLPMLLQRPVWLRIVHTRGRQR